MIYLDYAANTPVEKEVLKTFVDATIKYTANPNSSHPLGLEASKIIDLSSLNIAKMFNCDKDGIIYTSGASESNNLVIKGIADRYKEKGRHIIISPLEHSSIIAPCNYLANNGYEISVLSLNESGLVDLEELKQTWMAKSKFPTLFISAKDKTNIEQFKKLVYQEVKRLHVKIYPYNNFLWDYPSEE